MGYACPVCDAEQADAKHLANHLALTSSLGREDHREWLEEHAPDWADRGPEELGEIVSQYAPEIDTPEFEGGPQGQGHDPAHDHEPGRPFEDELARQARQPGRGAMTADAEGVLREAQELTRQMQQSSGSGEDVEDGERNENGDGDHAAHDASDRSSGNEDRGDGESERGNENV